MYAIYNRPKSDSVSDAQSKGLLLASFTIEPWQLSNEGYQYKFGEAWLETAYRPRHFLVWYSYQQKADWNYLCIRPATHWYQGNYSYDLTPQYDPPFHLEGFGVRTRGMVLTAGNLSPDLLFQQVPSDLKEFTVTVSVETYGKGKDVTVGTARFKAVD
jgi:hypothetical protein